MPVGCDPLAAQSWAVGGFKGEKMIKELTYDQAVQGHRKMWLELSKANYEENNKYCLKKKAVSDLKKEENPDYSQIKGLSSTLNWELAKKLTKK